MDMLSLVGLTVALGAIALGQTLEGGHLVSLVNGTAFIVVFGGTLGAILLQAPPAVFRCAMRRLVWVFLPPKVSMHGTIDKIVGWSHIARKEGLLGLENIIDQERDPFAVRGLQLLVDGAEPDEIRHALELDLSNREDFEYQAARLYEGMGGYAPTIGILGAVLGLIHVMENLADPSRLGAGIAAAFVATVYGVGLANLVFLPIANKLKSLVHRQSQLHEMTIEGLIAIAQGENPRSIESRLQGFIQS